MTETLELVIITGMSGAGKTVAVQSFEDLGYFCVDNMPPSLVPTFWELLKESGKITRVALVVDLRSRNFFAELEQVISMLDNTQFITTRILYLDANTASLVARYKETRRQHPLAIGEGRIVDAIEKEREMLLDLRTRAQMIIDTTTLSPRSLRERIMQQFSNPEYQSFHVEVMSFGFKYGAPIDADIVMDVRFLPNPHYIPELRPLTGLDSQVYDYVMMQPETQHFYTKLMDLLEFCLPGYKKEGKSSVTIAIGCTGGQHRSIALAERIANHLKNEQYAVNVTHRDRFKKKETVNRS